MHHRRLQLRLGLSLIHIYWELVEEPTKKSGGKKGGKKTAAEKVDEPAESADSPEDVKESDE